MQRLSSLFSTRRRIVLTLPPLCLVLVFLLSQRPPKLVPFQILHRPFSTPLLFRDRLGRWLPTTSWAWRLENAVFGRRRPVNFSTEILALPDSSPATLSTLALGAPNFSDPSGLQIWLFDADNLKALRERLKQIPGADILSRPRISTADGIETTLFQGQAIPLAGATNQVGTTLDYFARLHPDHTDLIASITLSELVTNTAALSTGTPPILSIQTNLDTAIRLQISKGCGLFLLHANPAQPSREPIALLLAPPQPKS